MKLCQQARRYWRYYNPDYKLVKYSERCVDCGKKFNELEVDHQIPLGEQPREVSKFGAWLIKLFAPRKKLRGRCKCCHAKKTKKERQEKAKAKKKK